MIWLCSFYYVYRYIDNTEHINMLEMSTIHLHFAVAPWGNIYLHDWKMLAQHTWRLKQKHKMDTDSPRVTFPKVSWIQMNEKKGHQFLKVKGSQTTTSKHFKTRRPKLQVFSFRPVNTQASHLGIPWPAPVALVRHARRGGVFHPTFLKVRKKSVNELWWNWFESDFNLTISDWVVFEIAVLGMVLEIFMRYCLILRTSQWSRRIRVVSWTFTPNSVNYIMLKWVRKIIKTHWEEVVHQVDGYHFGHLVPRAWKLGPSQDDFELVHRAERRYLQLFDL